MKKLIWLLGFLLVFAGTAMAAGTADDMTPVVVATRFTLRWRRRSGGIAVKPFLNVVQEHLLAPDHAGKRLTLHFAGVRIRDLRLQFVVESVRFLTALVERIVERAKRFRQRFRRQPQAHANLPLRWNFETVVGCYLRARLLWIHRVAISVDHEVVKCILGVGVRTVEAVESSRVRLVVAEQKFRLAIAVKMVLTQVSVAYLYGATVDDRHLGFLCVLEPRPRVSETGLRQEMDRRFFRPAVAEAYDSIQKIKGMADILIPLHDLSIGKMKTIP